VEAQKVKKPRSVQPSISIPLRRKSFRLSRG
jgi:hypothetical protein